MSGSERLTGLALVCVTVVLLAITGAAFKDCMRAETQCRNACGGSGGVARVEDGRCECRR